MGFSLNNHRKKNSYKFSTHVQGITKVVPHFKYTQGNIGSFFEHINKKKVKGCDCSMYGPHPRLE